MTHLLEHLRSRISVVVDGHQLDLDYFHVVNQEMFILSSASTIFDVPNDILETLMDLQQKISAALSQEVTLVLTRECGGGRGRPKFIVSEEMLSRLIEMSLPVSCIANILGVSQSTIFRRMLDFGLSVKTTYSTLSDNELDNAILAIKRRLPNAGCRMMKGCLQADGHRVQWNRIIESMQRVDAPGILERMTQLGYIVRRSYFVQSPLSLVHIDMNHKLIRYNVIIFVLHGLSVGCGSVWLCALRLAACAAGMRVVRDVWLSVTQLYYEVLHSLEEDGLLNLSDSLHVFCAHYVFLLCLKLGQSSVMVRKWARPNQMWIVGHMHNSIWNCLEQTRRHLTVSQKMRLEIMFQKLSAHSLLL
ncbi:Armadillo repeat-containing protein 6 [Labeo rohita]|uniref:Armadillo repeat-containing protein 6 n=1 Tax=Labeo rohita TaxID=84645 RepID=A0ABQ8L0C4_LABRO|nr:Armadillo repeat-containing protein 6 [Labeo rohita]